MGKWEMVRLGDAATFINGYSFKPTDWVVKGLPIIRIQNLTESSDVVNYFDQNYDLRYEINDGDILISWSASLGVYEWNKGKALLNQHIFKVVFNKLHFDKRFFRYIVGQKIDEMAQLTHGSTMKHITKKYFDEIQILYPPIEVQKKIADVLDRANALIEKRKVQIKKLDLLIKSQFVEMFGDSRDNDGVELREACTIITDGTHQPPKFVNSGVPFLLVSNIVDNKITYDTEKYITREDYDSLIKRTPIEVGDILLTTVGSYGNPAIVRSEREFCFQRHIAYMKPRRDLIDSVFLHNAFQSHDVQTQIEIRVKGIAQKTLNLSELKSIRVKLPPLDLQHRFAAFAEAADKSKFDIRRSIDLMELNFKSIMQKFFNAY
ncbi:MAG: restriction endonuclease subunit S [Clostridiales bacterium]|jgi:type I restriction enzyme S subunit|nr:restriction endonuclease subunit S [Clostridiales bacterium]